MIDLLIYHKRKQQWKIFTCNLKRNCWKIHKLLPFLVKLSDFVIKKRFFFGEMRQKREESWQAILSLAMRCDENYIRSVSDSGTWIIFRHTDRCCRSVTLEFLVYLPFPYLIPARQPLDPDNTRLHSSKLNKENPPLNNYRQIVPI